MAACLMSNCRFGFTQEVQQARVAHSDQYTSFVRARRIAAARKHLTQKEGGEDDINMGMQPYRQALCFGVGLSVARPL